jgi:putative NIF3 family GTP cyclohydrolase 1 type 2
VKTTVQDVLAWLGSLCEDRYPEDGLQEGRADLALQGVLLCWSPNAGARAAALSAGANLIIAHENLYYETPQRDPGCPAPEEWEVNRRIREFFRDGSMALVRSHRALDAYCLPRVLAEYLGFPPAVVHEGHKGYEFTLVHELAPVTLRELAVRLKARMELPCVRISPDDGRMIRRVGIAWGGVANSANLQYLERLRRHNVDAVIGGEVDEFAVEYYRESGISWIELGHYATEIVGLRQVARDMAKRFPSVPVTCFEDRERWAMA